MIRFACPGCAATFTVGDDKAGKAGKCPKCQSEFIIPDVPTTPADGAAAELAPLEPVPPPLPPPLPSDPPPLPSTPVGSNEAVEIRPCPGCQSRLSVAPTDLGLEIECPICQRQYRAVRADAPPPAGGSRRGSEGRLVNRERGNDNTEDDDRPRPRRRREDDDGDDPDRPYRRRRRYEDDYDRRLPAHRGPMILVFGILGFAFCFIFGIIAWVMGSQDIRAMDEGRMDPEGRGLTRAGQIIGMIAVLLNIFAVVFYCGLIGIVGIK